MHSDLAGHWLVTALGWAILHSIWQGAAIGAAAALALRALARSTGSRRYIVACTALALLASAWIATAAMYARRPPAARPAMIAAATTAPVPASILSSAPASSAVESTRHAVIASSRPWNAQLDAWSTVIVGIWLAGVLFLSLRLAFGWFAIHRLRRAAAPVADALRARTEAIAARLGVRHAIAVAHSAAVRVPTAIGWIRPMILLPVSALAGLSPEQLDAIIAHEIAHIRRYDYAINIVQTAIEIVIFYHPACWWLSRQIRHERELCCDDVAVEYCGDRVAYATALTDLEVLRGTAPALSLAATGPSARRARAADGALLRRVRRLVGGPDAAHRSSSWLAVAIPLVALSVAAISAQTRVPAAGRTVPADAGIVTGRVTDADSGRPIAGVRVQLLGPAGEIDVTTNAEGRYETKAITPGEYRMNAALPGYATADYGQTSESNEPGLPLAVSAGRASDGIDFSLHRAAAVTGRITNERDAPMAGVEIELLAMRPTPDGSKPMAIGFGQTDDDGAFRIDQVLPGDYWVRAYVDGEPDTTGADRLAYGSTFYPGVATFDAAQPVHVLGRLLPGIDFTLVPQKMYRVAGRLIDASGGAVAGIDVELHATGLDSTHDVYTATSDAAGRFVVPAAHAGEYLLNVGLMRVPRQAPSFAMRWAAATTHVKVQQNVDDVELRAQAPAHIEGRVVIDANDGHTPDVSGTRVLVQHRIAGGGIQMTGWTWKVKGDGTFAFDVPPAESTLEVDGLPDGWMVRRIIVDGLDVGDRPATLASGHTSQVEIAVTDRVTRVSGTVTTRKGTPVAGASVVVFPDGPLSSAIVASPHSRWIRQTRTDRDGRFEVAGLAPGAYLAVAVDHAPYFTIESPELLRQLAASATSLRLGDGERRTLMLRVVDAPAPVAATTPRGPRTARVVLKRVAFQTKRRTTQISGTVRDIQGRGVADATALLFEASSTSAQATAAGVRQARTDDQGRFTFAGVPAGSYYVLATKSPDYALTDTNLLGHLSTFATPVRIGAGEQRMVSLLILPPPPPPAPAPRASAVPRTAPPVDLSRALTERRHEIAVLQHELEQRRADVAKQQSELARQQREMEESLKTLTAQVEKLQREMEAATPVPR